MFFLFSLNRPNYFLLHGALTKMVCEKTRLKDTNQILFNMATCQLQANVIPAAPSTSLGNIDQEMIKRKKWKKKTLYIPAPICTTDRFKNSIIIT